MFDDWLAIFANVGTIEEVTRVELDPELVSVYSQLTLAAWVTKPAIITGEGTRLRVIGSQTTSSCSHFDLTYFRYCQASGE